MPFVTNEVEVEHSKHAFLLYHIETNILYSLVLKLDDVVQFL